MDSFATVLASIVSRVPALQACRPCLPDLADWKHAWLTLSPCRQHGLAISRPLGAVANLIVIRARATKLRIGLRELVARGGAVHGANPCISTLLLG